MPGGVRFHSLTRDIVIHTCDNCRGYYFGFLFPFPHAGHSDSYEKWDHCLGYLLGGFHSLARDIVIHTFAFICTTR